MAFSFKKAEAPRFAAKVEVPVPNERGGHDKQSFTAFFKRTSTDELRAIGEQGMTDADLIRDRLVGWEMKDAETNEDVPFTQETLEAVLQIQPCPKYIALAFWQHVSGGKS
ncbi:MAG: hypothetical protein JNK17_02120 [Hydrogenophaga sp.]|nr:hypothetical protein [Hydrogenophaga sp.]